MYANFFKRVLDAVLSFLALTVLFPFLLIFSVIGAFAMQGNPFFTQLRPGKKRKDGTEKIFRLIKFRTMNNKKDADGNLLPDEQRLNGYGRWLRSTSIDELPELINILVGDLSIVGPRPQLVRDMVFMSAEQRRRHDVRPGLTGLAQVSGRNNITWEQKFEYDLLYIDNGINVVNFIVEIFAAPESVRMVVCLESAVKLESRSAVVAELFQMVEPRHIAHGDAVHVFGARKVGVEN